MSCECTSGTPVCPYCWSLNIAPNPLYPKLCKCAPAPDGCGRSFVNAYCLTDAQLQAAVESGKIV